MDEIWIQKLKNNIYHNTWLRINCRYVIHKAYVLTACDWLVTDSKQSFSYS